MRIPSRLIFAVVLLVASAAGLQGQASPSRIDSEKEKVIRRILEVTKSSENMLVTMETSLPAQRASNPNIPDVFWDRFMTRARAQRGAFIDSLIPIYDKHFSLPDLQAMLRFYETDAGKRMVAALPEVMRESMLAGQRWGAVIGQDVAAQLQREGVLPRAPNEQ